MGASPSFAQLPFEKKIVATAVEIWIHLICTLLGNFYLLFVLLSFFVFLSVILYIMLAREHLFLYGYG